MASGPMAGDRQQELEALFGENALKLFDALGVKLHSCARGHRVQHAAALGEAPFRPLGGAHAHRALRDFLPDALHFLAQFAGARVREMIEAFSGSAARCLAHAPITTVRDPPCALAVTNTIRPMPIARFSAAPPNSLVITSISNLNLGLPTKPIFETSSRTSVADIGQVTSTGTSSVMNAGRRR
jgi:hypothetical protein